MNSIQYIDNLLAQLETEYLEKEPDKRPFSAFKLHLRTLRSIIIGEFKDVENELGLILDEIKKVNEEASKLT